MKLLPLAAMAFIGATTFIIPGHALDVPFGSDALGSLTEQAEVIATGTEVQIVTSNRHSESTVWTLYSVRLDRVLKGPASTGAEILAALRDERPDPSSPVLEPQDARLWTLMFLRKVKSDDDIPANWPRDKDLYVVVNGAFGLLSGTPGAQTEAIAAYLSASRGEAADMLGWAERYISSSDSFIQRSSTLELVDRSDNPRAQVALIAALRMEDVDATNKLTMIEALQEAEASQALEALRELAENSRQPERLRTKAVLAAAALPNGIQQIQTWMKSSDALIAEAARAASDQKR